MVVFGWIGWLSDVVAGDDMHAEGGKGERGEIFRAYG